MTLAQFGANVIRIDVLGGEIDYAPCRTEAQRDHVHDRRKSGLINRSGLAA
jgi:hypothetical protein